MTRAGGPRGGRTSKPRRLQWSARARRDLLDIGDYIARDDPAAAQRFVDALIEKAEIAGRMPSSGRVVPEIGRDDVRELIHGRYRIVYQIEAATVEILTVFHGAQQLR